MQSILHSAASSAFSHSAMQLQEAHPPSNLRLPAMASLITHQHRNLLRIQPFDSAHTDSGHTHSCHSQEWRRVSSYILSLHWSRKTFRLTRARRVRSHYTTYQQHKHATLHTHHTHTHTDHYTAHTYVQLNCSTTPASSTAIDQIDEHIKNHTLTRFHLVGGRAWHLSQTNGKNPNKSSMEPPSPLPSHLNPWKDAMHWNAALCASSRIAIWSAHTTSRGESTASPHP